jgi:signal peptidase I
VTADKAEMRTVSEVISDAAGTGRPGHPEQALRTRPGLAVSVVRSLAVIAAVLAVTAVHLCVLPSYRIPSGSMANTLQVGDVITVDTIGFRVDGIHRGNVIVFTGKNSWDAPGQSVTYVKRVIGLPGDVVAGAADGTVTVNGHTLHEPYAVQPPGAGSPGPFGPVLVQPGQLFVLGDHRDDSYDSRYRGTIPAANVIGRVDAVTYPLRDLHWVHSPDPLH